jgi:hypothetical protein
VLRVLVVVLGGDPIVTSRRLLRKREVPLVYLEGVSLNSLAKATTVECLIELWPSWLLAGWPICSKATARPLIGS